MKYFRFWQSLLPTNWFYAEHLTQSASLLIRRGLLGLAGLLMSVLAIGLFGPGNWRELLAGGLLAWGVSVLVWAVASYKENQSSLFADLRRMAETDVLHHRLNQIAERVGAPALDIDRELEPMLARRTERLAHFTGLDEFREQALPPEDRR